MNGIFYFSSTGNSLYIAKYLKEKLSGKIRFIPKYSRDTEAFEKVIIVSPIYSFGLPIPVFDFIGKLKTDAPVYIVLNYGGMKSSAEHFTYQTCIENNLNVKAIYSVKMPENFTLTFTPPKIFTNSVLKKAPATLNGIAESIRADAEFIPSKPFSDKTKTYLKNKGNWHIIGKRFSVTEDCIHCGKCISVCPADNIEELDGAIKFEDKCIACLGCYHRCPQKAIRYMNKTKKDRYINPNINENEIGQDIE